MIGRHGREGGLLRHGLREPDGVWVGPRARRAVFGTQTPGQTPPMAVVPAQQGFRAASGRAEIRERVGGAHVGLIPNRCENTY